MTEKNRVLQDAPIVLNQPDRPWEVTVEGDTIIANWKWMDATFFAPDKVTHAIKNFTFLVTLKDNGKWKELDKVAQEEAAISKNGAQFSKKKFVGKTMQKSIQIGVGAKDGKIGVIKSEFDTAAIKTPIRDYLMQCGWKKAGLFG